MYIYVQWVRGLEELWGLLTAQIPTLAAIMPDSSLLPNFFALNCCHWYVPHSLLHLCIYRWLDGITDSMDKGWVDSGSWWWTGRPGMLQLMGSQRVGHDWATELNWYVYMCIHMHVCVCVCVCGVFSSSIDIFYGCTSQMTIAQLPPMMSIWPMGNLPWAPQIEVEISYPQGIPDPLPVISLQLPFLLQRHRGRSAIPLSWS